MVATSIHRKVWLEPLKVRGPGMTREDGPLVLVLIPLKKVKLEPSGVMTRYVFPESPHVYVCREPRLGTVTAVILVPPAARDATSCVLIAIYTPVILCSCMVVVLSQ